MARQEGRDKKQSKMREDHLNEVFDVISELGHAPTRDILPKVKMSRRALIDCLNELKGKKMITRLDGEYYTEAGAILRNKGERDKEFKQSIQPVILDILTIESEWYKKNKLSISQRVSMMRKKQNGIPETTKIFLFSNIWSKSLDIKIWNKKLNNSQDEEIYFEIQKLIKLLIKKGDIKTINDSKIMLEISFNIESMLENKESWFRNSPWQNHVEVAAKQFIEEI